MGEETAQVRCVRCYPPFLLVDLSPSEVDAVELARFKGRPGEMSPKARLWLLAGYLMPSRFKYGF